MTADVSVVIAVFNGAWCIRRALDAALAQTRPPREILVCDDGSTDGTAELVEAHYAAPVRVLRLDHVQAAAARHAGLQQARGEWIAFLDADDWWEPNKLERQLEFAARHPEVRWMSTDGWYDSEQGVVRESWLADYFDPVREVAGDLFPALVERCFPLMSSTLVRRDAYEAVGGMDPTIPHSHDYDLWLRLGARYPGGILSDRLSHYWTHPGAISRQYEARYREDLMLLERIERGELRSDPAIQRRGRERRASHCFDLGQLCLRTGRTAEGKAFLRRALDAGPPARRLAAVAGLVLPAAWLPWLRGLRWLRRPLASLREPAHRIDGGDPR